MKKRILTKDSGQAVVEYALALSVIVIVLVGGSSLVTYMNTSSQKGRYSTTYSRAPYTVSSSVGGSGQCAKDIAVH